MLTALLFGFLAQAPAKIDFVRDVQPIFRERCVSCHGPDLRMGGLRLDRRADALRGGTQTDIGPGNADGSRLYHRVAGTAFGPQMPPTGRLTDAQIDIVHEWIDQGAEWPDEASGEPRTVLVDPKTRQLMNAALYGNARLLQRHLSTGADPNAASAFGVTPLMLAVPDVAKMQLLLDAGADVNARSDEGRSALTIAAGTVGAAPAVRLLLEYGADVTLVRASDASPMREAMRINDREIQQALSDYGALTPIIRPGPALDAKSTAPLYDPGRLAVPTPRGVAEANAATIRSAIERSLPLLQDTGIAFIKQTGCVSCHHNSVVSMAVATARAKGYKVNEALVETERSMLATYLESWRERALQNIPIAGGADTMSYLLIGLSADNHPRDEATDAQAIWIKRHQLTDGHWPVASNRPPIEWDDIAVTALSMRALQLYAPPQMANDLGQAVQRARTWLAQASAQSTNERMFRLLGLAWAKASSDEITSASRELVERQREDGGWAQLEKSGSDAYATGIALYALHESGMAAADPVYRKGVAFLLRTQMEDGSWFVSSRATPIQAYFESGFPYGLNQWISAAATAWATAALALSQ